MSHHNKALEKKVNAGTGRRLTKAEQKYKTRNWPKSEMTSKKASALHKKLSSSDR